MTEVTYSMTDDASLVRTQVLLTRSQVRQLRTQAAQRGTSMAELVRRAVDAWLSSEGSSTVERRQRALDAVGRYASGRRDVSGDHDRHLEDVFGS